MKAIKTTYHGPTLHRAKRWTATDGAHNRISIPEDQNWQSLHDGHDAAALALCQKMNWPGDLIAGELPTHHVYVFAADRRIHNPTQDKPR